jgi:hypothetical protein
LEEALLGLPGVEAVEADLKRDLLKVRFDPGKQTPKQMLEEISDRGFEGKVVPREGPPSP